MLKNLLLFSLLMASAHSLAEKIIIGKDHGIQFQTKLQGSHKLYRSLTDARPSMRLMILDTADGTILRITDACVAEGCIPSMSILTQKNTPHSIILDVEIDYAYSKRMLDVARLSPTTRLRTRIFILNSGTGIFLHWVIYNQDIPVFELDLNTRRYRAS